MLLVPKIFNFQSPEKFCRTRSFVTSANTNISLMITIAIYRFCGYYKRNVAYPPIFLFSV